MIYKFPLLAQNGHSVMIIQRYFFFQVLSAIQSQV